MNKIFILFVIIFLTIGCGNSFVEKPDNLIDDDTMVDIFYDLALIEARKNSSFENGVSNFKDNNFIYKKYKIDSLQFAKSNRYWATDIAKYKRLYKIVRDRLNDNKIEIENSSKLQNSKK